ncbi:hypothetical protein JCM10207_001223 [Rhodosporidiobolus poonsookiae]
MHRFAIAAARPSIAPSTPSGRFLRTFRGPKPLPPWDRTVDSCRPQPLFRTPPPSSIPPRTSIRPHPIFDSFELIDADLRRMTAFLDRRAPQSAKFAGYRFLRVARLPVAGDFATSPAVRQIELVFKGIVTAAENPQGVTVLDVMQASARLWASKPPLPVAEEVASVYNSHPLQLELYRPEEITWQHALFDHRFFEGFQEVDLVKSGKDARVRMEAWRLGS